MDGNVSFDVEANRVTAAPILPDAACNFDFMHVQLENISRDFAHKQQDANPLLHWLFKWVDGGAVILSTFAAAWAATLFLTHREAMDQVMPDIIAVLVFFLTLRLR